MWSAVTPPPDAAAPSSRSKHSATLLGGHVYLLGGRNGNLPLKDLWRYSLADSRWEQLQPSGERPPCLQEHTAVAHRDSLYVFGGEVGFSAGTETPLWVYHVKGNCWRKVRSQKGVSVPRGRRGHSALVHRGTMLVYGGYQDLRGSSSELWGFHFDTESWHLLCGRGGPSDAPPARHKHSAVMHDDMVWVYGGMTDLQERSDLWRWDTVSRCWSCVRSKPGPGPLHSHAVCKLPSSMLIFGGERDGQPTDELWRFHFGTETWERVQVSGPRPRARSESVALAVSELLLTKLTFCSSQHQQALRGHHRVRGSGSVDRNSRHPSGNRVSPCDDKQLPASTWSHSEGGGRRPAGGVVVSANGGGFLREISKLSQINLSRLSHHKCSYSVLTSSSHDESTESLLLQNSTTSEEASLGSKMVKSRSASVLARNNLLPPPTSLLVARHASYNPRNNDTSSSSPCTLPRDPLSVPNFGTVVSPSSASSIPVPVLTPVEVTRLVYFDTDDELENDVFGSVDPTVAKAAEASPHVEFSLVHRRFQPAFRHDERSDSYNSHLVSAGEKGRARNCDDASDETMSTSDYASIASASNYSMCNRLSPVDQFAGDFCSSKTGRGGTAKARTASRDNVVGFCNPNYLGPDIHTILNQRKSWQASPARMLNSPPDSVLEDTSGRSISRELMELHGLDKKKKCRASSASRAEQCPEDKDDGEDVSCFSVESPVPLYMFVLGGKEQGQVTVFKRPVSVWKLQLAPNIY